MPVWGRCKECGYDSVIDENCIVCMRREIEKLWDEIDCLEKTVNSCFSIIQSFIRNPEKTKKMLLHSIGIEEKDTHEYMDLSIFRDLEEFRKITEDNSIVKGWTQYRKSNVNADKSQDQELSEAQGN